MPSNLRGRELRIRPGRAGDTRAIHDLYVRVAAVSGGLARHADEIDLPYVEDFVNRSLADGVIFVAEAAASGSLAGEVHAYRNGLRRFAHVLGSLTVAVDPDSQGRGIGRRLFEALLAEVRDQRPDIVRVELITQQSNVRGQRLYESLGFRRQGRFEQGIRGPDGALEADLPMAWLRWAPDPQAAMVPLARWTVGVIGSGTHPHEALANDVGALLAKRGVNLLTGAGRGVMAAVSRAFTATPRREGICIGIVPSRAEATPTMPKDGYPNPFVELPIYTHLPGGALGTDRSSRNHINVLSSDAIIALPGESGTESEVTLALAYARPLIAYAPDPRLVARFPEVVERASTAERLDAFLDQALTD